MYRGTDSVHKFFTDIFEEEKEILEKLKSFQNTPLNLSYKEKMHHKNATKCYVCDCSFTDKNRKVRDHCHVLRNYRGAACNTCNLSMKMTKTIPVIFHNLKGYDSHLLLPELGKFNKKISIIPNNMQTYMSFSVGNEITYTDVKTGELKKKDWFNLRFIDSFGFMASSLSQLVVDLKQGGLDKFKNEHGFSPNWTEQIYKIHKINKSKPVTYILKDLQDEIIEGGFYKEELQKTSQEVFRIEKISRKKKINGIDHGLVKWIGYSDKFNEWLPVSKINSI